MKRLLGFLLVGWLALAAPMVFAQTCLTLNGQPLVLNGAPMCTSAVVVGGLLSPRLAPVSQSFNQDYATQSSTFIAWAQLMDTVTIGGNWETNFQGNSYNRQTFVTGIEAGSSGGSVTITPKVLQYGTDDHVYNGSGGSQPNTSGSPTWTAQFGTIPTGGSPGKNWFLWVSHNSGTNIINPTGTCTSPCTNDNLATNTLDLGSGSKDGNGNAMDAAFSKYESDYYFGANNSNADAASSLSGFFHDVWCPACAATITGDWQQTGTEVASTNITVAEAYWNGLAEGVAQWRTRQPGKLFIGNTGFATKYSDNASQMLFQRSDASTVMGNAWGVEDGALWEAPIGASFSIETFGGITYVQQLLNYNASGVVKTPADSLIDYDEGWSSDNLGNMSEIGGGGGNGNGLRYTFTATLIFSNAQYGFEAPFAQSGTSSAYAALWWPEYGSVNSSTGVVLSYANSTQAQLAADRYWEGTAIDPPQTGTATQVTFTGGPKCYARRFLAPSGRTVWDLLSASTNNNSGQTACVFHFSPGVTFLTGTGTSGAGTGANWGANSGIDSGATGQTTVTVAVGDGQIVLQ